MSLQINKDFDDYKKRPISLSQIDDLFNKRRTELALAKFIISNNEIFVEQEQPQNTDFVYRTSCFRDALILLSKSVQLPDTVFILTMHDEVSERFNIPLFAMAKKITSNHILVPDFEAIQAKYQVLKNQDITEIQFPWNKKITQLVWRGSSAQRGFDNSPCIRSNNLGMFSRVRLCKLSCKFPDLIDAKFTILRQVENPALLRRFLGEYVTYEKQLEYKYHIVIDGNTCTYTSSGWKFFTNSVVFKPDSPRIQWYYNALVPNVHYIPVRASLKDLVEKIQWAASHDVEAEIIAHNARDFANSHLTVIDSLAYLYHTILQYSQLQFVN